MTTIILVIIGILAVGLAVFSWRFENCGTVDTRSRQKAFSRKIQNKRYQKNNVLLAIFLYGMTQKRGLK